MIFARLTALMKPVKKRSLRLLSAFLSRPPLEDAIRTAISLGGDSDTIRAITGAIAEAYYGVPKAIKEKALTYLDEDLRVIYDEWRIFRSSLYPISTIQT